jgi:ribonuclease VapC
VIAVDSSVLVAIIRQEPEAAAFDEVLDRTDAAVMSVVSYVETSMVASGRRTDADPRRVDHLLSALGIELVPVTPEQGTVAVEAFLRFGKGRHPAGLNLADCFTYALAKSRGIPLLFKGDDFPMTDITPVLRLENDRER